MTPSLSIAKTDGLADLNGDDTLEVLVANAFGRDVSVIYNVPKR